MPAPGGSGKLKNELCRKPVPDFTAPEAVTIIPNCTAGTVEPDLQRHPYTTLTKYHREKAETPPRPPTIIH